MSMDVHPVISVDRRLGKYVDNIDFDYAALTNYMRQRGFNDDQIGLTEIIFDGDPDNPDAVGVDGSYFYDTGEIEVYPLWELRRAHESQLASGKPSSNDGAIPLHFGAYYSKVITHEIEHKAIDEIDGGVSTAELTKYVGKIALLRFVITGGSFLAAEQLLEFVGNGSERVAGLQNMYAVSVLAMIAAYKLTNSQRYKDVTYHISPEEEQCFTAEETAPEGIVIIESKSFREPLSTDMTN